jgi:hypothetical protein
MLDMQEKSEPPVAALQNEWRDGLDIIKCAKSHQEAIRQRTAELMLDIGPI